MIKPIGTDELQPLFVYDTDAHEALSHEAESLPSVIISSQAAGNAVQMGAGYFSPLKGFMNVADAMGAAENMTLTDGSFFPVPVMCLLESTGLNSFTSRSQFGLEQSSRLSARQHVFLWQFGLGRKHFFNTTKKVVSAAQHTLL